MMDEIKLSECEYFDSGLIINPTEFNLFIGVNGSGKSRLLKHIFGKSNVDIKNQVEFNYREKISNLKTSYFDSKHNLNLHQKDELNILKKHYGEKQNHLDPESQEFTDITITHDKLVGEVKTKYFEKHIPLNNKYNQDLNNINKKYTEEKNLVAILINEDRFYNGKLNYLTGKVNLKNIQNTTNIAAKTSELKQLNEDLKYLFDRTVSIENDVEGNWTPNFMKNNTRILTKNDGRGIVNAWTIFEYVAFAPDIFPLFVEEISTGLHQSLLEKYLNRLFERLEEKKMQLFATSQDPFTAFYFLKNKLDKNGDWVDDNQKYSVFSFSDNDGTLCVEKNNKR